MKLFRFFFHGLRGRLIFTYTAVTVLALLALEVLLLVIGLFSTTFNNGDKNEYLNDVLYTLYPQAQAYLRPGQEDLPGLQAWLDYVAESGYASLEPQDLFDSPAAKFEPGAPLYVLSPDGVILAEWPHTGASRVGEVYTPVLPGARDALQNAWDGWYAVSHLYALTPKGEYWFVAPIPREHSFGELVGALVMTLEPPPSLAFQVLPEVLGWVATTGLILLCGVAPFGAVFGLILSGRLTRRLATLTAAADAWGAGDFRAMPADLVDDEIGLLSRRMRAMAERIQGLLQDREALAQMEERNRLARELHDTVKQQNFATLMQVRAARNQLGQDPAAASQHLLEAENLIKSSQQELALMISELRPAALEEQGLAEALQIYLNTWSAQACIPVSFQVNAARRLPLEMEQAFYRVAQEALSNVARHSRASAVVARLDYAPNAVRLEIQDNGVGFEAIAGEANGFGLQSMRERMAAFNGRLEVRSASGEGARIVAEAPVN